MSAAAFSSSSAVNGILEELLLDGREGRVGGERWDRGVDRRIVRGEERPFCT
jgi:hypothetical protein